MRIALFTTAALTLVTASPALAQCEPDPVLGVTTCTGEDPDGFEDATDGAVVIVTEDASVDAAGDAIVLSGESAALDNAGDVTGGEDAVRMGPDGTLTNFGLIEGGDDGVDAEGSDRLTVFNAGTIRGGAGEGNRGLALDGTTGVTVENEGTIEAFDEAIEADGEAEIINRGMIASGGEDGVQVQENGTIVNAGTIFGGLENGDGIDIDSGLIDNQVGGLIESRARGLTGTDDGAEAGIDIDDGDGMVDIINDGTIRGEIGILEDAGNTGGHLVSNAGLIEGTGGIAVSFLGEGDDTVVLIEGGDFVGDVLLGEDDDYLVLDGIMAATVGTNTLFDGGLGEDTIVFDASVALGDIVRVAMSAAMEGANELTFVNADGSRSLIVLAGFELAEIGGQLFALDDLAPIPLPGAALFFLTAIAVGRLARRA